MEQKAANEAYASGYADGVAAADGALASSTESYQAGSRNGLAEARETTSPELCDCCYGAGFEEGYKAGFAAGVATGDVEQP